VYGQSVYTALSAVGPDQLSAMPSVHVGWAVLVAVAAWTLTTSRWRWLAVGHAIVTVLVVVATANHFWLDGIVATVVLAVVLALQNQADHLRRYLSIRRAQIPVISPDSAPAPAGFD
jgi:MFS superfamily sulfate permease-like transporter